MDYPCLGCSGSVPPCWTGSSRASSWATFPGSSRRPVSWSSTSRPPRCWASPQSVVLRAEEVIQSRQPTDLLIPPRRIEPALLPRDAPLPIGLRSPRAYPSDGTGPRPEASLQSADLCSSGVPGNGPIKGRTIRSVTGRQWKVLASVRVSGERHQRCAHGPSRAKALDWEEELLLCL
jgi:hypothetical protein